MFIRLQIRPLYRASAAITLLLLVHLCDASLYPAFGDERGNATPAAAVDANEITGRLAALTPKYPAPPAGILSLRDEYPLPLALLGVDLAQDGLADAAGLPVLTGRRPLTVTAYWTPRATVRRTVDIEIRLTSANPLISRSQKLVAGPTDAPEWSAGSVYRQQYTIDLDKIPQAFSGKGALIIAVSPRPGPNPQYFPLQSIPFSLETRITKSSVAPEALRAAFGEGFHDLGMDFILGSDASHTVMLEPALRDRLAALGVVSAFGYGGISQGTPVCNIVFTDENGQTAQAAVVCGVDTARADYDFASPEKANHKKAPIVESGEAVDFNTEGRAFRRHKYGATIPVPKGLGRVVSLQFRGMTDRIYEVYDVVLLYGEVVK
ncbi:MAG: hypothetical protein HZB26_02610 [Candidatus Hydrogenedentes bacterium]|nr:hypothetical protein [Candidatus Hydrogenedentota bacterium]